MNSQLQLGDISVDVVHKDIKNIHLSVYPPDGRVKISAPSSTKLESIRLFAIDKLSWIKAQQRKLKAQHRETPREYLERESHYLWGKRYLLSVHEQTAAARVELKHTQLILHIKPNSSSNQKRDTLDAFYRKEVYTAAKPLLQKWTKKLGVSPSKLRVRRMKTKWGSCNPAKQTLNLNTELAKKPSICLEYILVHELMHILEPTHNAHFQALMDLHMPKWRFYREQLNNLPVRHEDWVY